MNEPAINRVICYTYRDHKPCSIQPLAQDTNGLEQRKNVCESTTQLGIRIRIEWQTLGLALVGFLAIAGIGYLIGGPPQQEQSDEDGDEAMKKKRRGGPGVYF